jgi:RND family efflux transporter MFP subunit
MALPGKTRQQGDGLPVVQTSAELSSSRVPALRKPPEPPASAGRRRWWLWLAGGMLAALTGGLVYLQPWTPALTPVAVEQVAVAPVTRLLAVNGRIAAVRSVDVRALVGGNLTDVAVSEGQLVAVGQVLARIDATAQNAIVRQAVAGLDAALVAQEQAEATLARSQALTATVSTAALETDRRAVRSAMQEVAQMTARLEQAQVELARYTVPAPISGTIINMDADLGQVADTATVLMTVADLSNLVIETDVDEAYANEVSVGQQVVLRFLGETQTRAGQVRTVAGLIDTATGGLAIRIGFDAEVSAPIGLTVTANILVDQREAALSVPRTALVTQDNGDTAVFLARNGVAHLQPVSVIDWPAARLVVTEGLSPGDPLIIDAVGLSDGQRIRVDAP